ncbi:MAG: thioredoxin family protein [Crocinitomicaceae bacterium]
MSSFKEIINSSQPTLVDFHATWCGPCKAMAPVLDQLKSELGDSIRVLKIDIDKNQALANQLNVRGVPLFILYKSGQIVWKQSGGMSLSTLVSKIKPSIG